MTGQVVIVYLAMGMVGLGSFSQWDRLGRIKEK